MGNEMGLKQGRPGWWEGGKGREGSCLEEGTSCLPGTCGVDNPAGISSWSPVEWLGRPRGGGQLARITNSW